MAKTNAVRIETINELKEHKPKAYLQEKIGVILTQISNFAFDSTVDLSLKTLTGLLLSLSLSLSLCLFIVCFQKFMG